MAKTSKISKKAARRQIEKKLAVTFAALEPVLGNKDFKRRLKKAGKAITKGLKNKKSRLAMENLRKLHSIEDNFLMNKNKGLKNYSPQTVRPLKKKPPETVHEN